MIFFFYGKDTFRANQKIQEIRKKFRKEVDVSGSNEHIFVGKEAKFEQIRNALSALGFFSNKRLLIIKNIFSNKTLSKEFLEYIENKKTEENIVVLWEDEVPDKRSALWKYLLKNARNQEFPLLSLKNLVSWIINETKHRGGAMDESVAILLSQTFSENMWGLSHELDKLIAFADGALITTLLIVDFLSDGTSLNIFNFLDAFREKNKKEIAKIFHHLIKEENPLGMLSLIHREIRLLWQTRQLKEKLRSSKELAQILEIHPYVAEKLWRKAQNFELRELSRLIDQAVRAELDIKTGKKPAALALEMLLLSTSLSPSSNIK